MPGLTGSGESVLLTARSACLLTVVMAVPVLLLLFGSAVVALATALLVITEAAAALELTLTTNVKVAVSPAATVALEKTTLPVPPTDGGLGIDHPEPVAIAAEKNVVPVGTASATVTV